MPIDFAAVAALYQEQFANQTHQLKPLFERLADAIKILDQGSNDAERATRAYPVLRYRDEALCVTVDARLMPQLPRSPSLGFVDGLKDGATRFIGELGFAKTAVDQEIAIPQMLSPFVAMVGSVLASLERFERPTSLRSVRGRQPRLVGPRRQGKSSRSSADRGTRRRRDGPACDVTIDNRHGIDGDVGSDCLD
jgi:hypothetical protein